MGLSEPELRQRIMEAIGSGALPRTAPSQRWAGHGGGEHCDGCGRPIIGSEVEVEAEIDEAGRQRSVRFHLHCSAIWEEIITDFPP